MAYTPVTFVYGEVLTATKMNLLAANDASFHDGSGLPTISTSMLASNAVTTEKINGSAVTTEKIAGSAVTTEKINGSAVTTEKVANEAITPSKINFNEFADAAISNTGSITLGAGKWLIALVRKVNQTNASQAAILFYTVPGTTISDTFACPPAPSGAGQNVFVNMVDFAVVDISSSTTFSISNTTQTNVTVSSRWFALPLKH